MAERDAIIKYMDALLEVDDFKDYIPKGLQIEGRPEIKKIATGVSVCMEILEAAAEWGADMVLVHHGMFWDRSDPVLRGHQKARVKFLLEHDMTLAGYHLPLDAHGEVGNNILFARAMGFENIEPFGLYNGKMIGWKGTFPPNAIENFVDRARAFYGTDPRAFLYGPKEITSAAVISGGAWDEFMLAVREDIDCYVTGNADEPVYHQAREEKKHFLSFGHYATERVGVRRLGEVVAEEFGVEVRFFDVDNPL